VLHFSDLFRKIRKKPASRHTRKKAHIGPIKVNMKLSVFNENWVTSQGFAIRRAIPSAQMMTVNHLPKLDLGDSLIETIFSSRLLQTQLSPLYNQNKGLFREESNFSISAAKDPFPVGVHQKEYANHDGDGTID
jgi:hypothetical protein